VWRSFGHNGPRGPEDGPPALVIPGFIADDRTTMELRRALADAGYRVHPWNCGWNLGARDDTVERLKVRLGQIAGDRPVLVVGWSLGGVFARELARAAPEKVRAVVTLGSPFSGNLKTNNNVRTFYEWVAGHDVNLPPFERFGIKPPVPTLAIWSRKDGIVAPAAARGKAHEVDKAVELDAGHTEFVASRPVLSRIVGEIRTFLTAMEGEAPRMGTLAARP
jgi:pimeloyl-ACP methyl ester carboxylesterase